MITKYRTKDGEEFFDLEEAVEHENKITPMPTTDAVYEQFITIQEAINKAVAEKRVVRFLYSGDKKELRKGIVDKKGCSIMSIDKDSPDVAVIPSGINNFDFNEVDTTVTVKGD